MSGAVAMSDISRENDEGRLHPGISSETINREGHPDDTLDSADHKSTPSVASLKILIVGAGIAGLTAAIGLRKEGHEVHNYEQSQLAEEIGAAIHITPNAGSILQRLGVRHEEKGAIKLIQTRYFDSHCNLLSVTPNDADRHRWQAEWLQAHRGHLHAHLKESATEPGGSGTPATIHTSSRIVSVDPHRAEIRFETGETIRGDAVIGADGVRSSCRPAVAGPRYDSVPYGKSAFRFMVPRAKVLEDPETKELGEVLGSLDMFFSPENKVIIYPCVNNALLNVVCIHPSHLSEASAETYNKSVSKSKVLEVFYDFDQRILKLLEKCDSDSLKVWPLLDALNMPTFVSDRLALIGDAAHPFTPFIGQGGAMAIEDAAALTVMLSRGVTAAGVPERLQLYDKARLERATLIQRYSRAAGGDGVKPGEEKAAKMRGREHALYALSHDETHASAQLLREHLWQNVAGGWRQPLAFGPFPVPSGGQTGATISVKFKTSATLLRTLFPNASYAFFEKDTVAVAGFSIRSHGKAGLVGSHQVFFEVHGVSYTKSDGSRLQGRYVPIMLEDSADAISVSRETYGLPSVFSDVDVDDTSPESVRVTLSWKGVKWASLWLKDLKQEAVSPGPLPTGSFADAGAFVHKYIPHTAGRPSKDEVDAEYDILLSDYPSALTGVGDLSDMNGTTMPRPHDRLCKSSSNAGFEIMLHHNDKLPTLHHVVSRLRELPVFSIVEATVFDAGGSLYPDHVIRVS